MPWARQIAEAEKEAAIWPGGVYYPYASRSYGFQAVYGGGERGANPHPVADLKLFDPLHFGRISSPSPRGSGKADSKNSIVVNTENGSDAIAGLTTPTEPVMEQDEVSLS